MQRDIKCDVMTITSQQQFLPSNGITTAGAEQKSKLNMEIRRPAMSTDSGRPLVPICTFKECAWCHLEQPAMAKLPENLAP